MSDYRFFHPTEIRYGDLDPQGHLNNARFLTYFEQARILYLVELGLFGKNQSFMEIGVIVADLHITFLAPVLWGMEVKVGVKTLKMGNKSMTVAQNLVDCATGKELARAEVVLVTYDYQTETTIPIPNPWREAIHRHES